MRILLLLAVLALPASAAAQGLGDAAARERQKRTESAKPAPPKVFTNEDLPESAPPPAGDAEAAAPADPDSAADPPSPGAATGSGDAEPAAAPAAGPADPLEKERQDRELLEAEWRVRFANAREQLAIAEADSWREVVRTEFVSGIPVQMMVKEQVETAELRQARQALADLEEEFRRSGLPPGWARER